MTDKFAHRAADWDQPEKIKMASKFVEAALKYIELQTDWKALEIGAGTGLVGMMLLPQINSIVFEDTSEAMLNVLRKKTEGQTNLEIVHGEATDYTKQDIDLVVSNMSFHHIEDIPSVLEHLYMICNPGAKLAIGDIRSEDGSFHRFEPIPHKGFDTDWLSAEFEKAGFLVKIAETYRTLKRERIPGVISNYEQFILIAEKSF